MKFGTRSHDTKLLDGTKNQPVKIKDPTILYAGKRVRYESKLFDQTD